MLSLGFQIKQLMVYPLIAVGLFVVFLVYAFYLFFVKKDMKQFKAVLYPGLFFIVVWAAIYFIFLK